MTAPEKKVLCGEWVRSQRYRYNPMCGRPAKGTLANGKPACGVHLNAEKKDREAAAARELEREERKLANQKRIEERAVFKALAEELGRLGVKVRVTEFGVPQLILEYEDAVALASDLRFYGGIWFPGEEEK